MDIRLCQSRLPKLHDDALSAISSINQSLRELPQPPSENQTADLRQLIIAFSLGLNSLEEGGKAHASLLQHCRLIYKQFQTKVACTRHNFVPYEKCDPRYDWKDNEIEDFDLEVLPVPPTKRRRIYLDEVTRDIEK